jgi:hypothetical protein
MEKDIEQLAYEEVTKKLQHMHLKDIGPYFHGWFDCLYFMDKHIKNKEIIEKKEKEVKTCEKN